MKFDDVIEELGGFGRYQKRTYFLVCLMGIPAALQTMVAVFIMDTPGHRCEVPGINDSYSLRDDHHRQLVDQHVPWDQDEEDYDQCKLFVDHSQSNGTAKCSRWVYDREVYKETVISEFDIVCDDHILRSHANSILFGGILVGALVMGTLSDMIGRRKALLLGVTLTFASSVTCSFMPTYWSYVALRFCTSAGTTGMFMCSFVIGMELVGPAQRTLAGIMIEMFWCLGLFIVSAAGYGLREWRHLQLALSVPLVVFFAYYWIMPESARWLISKGRLEEASMIVRHAAKVNRADVSEKVLSLQSLEEEGQREKLWKIFYTPVLLFRTLIIFLNWMVVSMVYYGLGLNVSALSGDVFVNFTIANVVELSAYVFCLLLLDRVGRKLLHSSTMILSGLACLATMFPVIYGDESLDWLTVTLSMVGKFGASAAFAIIYMYSAEIYPTTVRNSCMGASSMCARVGGMVSPYIADLGAMVSGDIGTALPLIIFGVASLVAGLLALFLPETLGRQLPENLQDAETFGRKDQGKRYSPSNSLSKDQKDKTSDDMVMSTKF